MENKSNIYLSVKRVARMLDVSVRTVRNYIKYEGLQAIKTRKYGPYRISVAALEEWLQAHTTKKEDDQQ